MKDVVRLALMIGAVALFAGCGSFQTSSLSALPTTDTSNRKSWVSSDEKRERRLLFVSDSQLNEIDIYSLPGMELKGQLTGSNINYPNGLCSDTAGNVYVTEEGQVFSKTDNPEIDKYSRTGSLLAQIPDTYGFPDGCAVDPATNDLAVANFVIGSAVGNVLVFSNLSSPPKVLTNPSQPLDYQAAGYGPHSSLWVGGTGSDGDQVLSRCGPSDCTTINVSGGTLNYLDGVQWDGTRRTWVIFENCNNHNYGGGGACTVPISKKGRLGVPTIYENYNGGTVCGFGQGEIAENGKHVVGSSFVFPGCGGTASSSVYRWGYKGGMPLSYAILLTEYAEPSGVAISTK